METRGQIHNIGLAYPSRNAVISIEIAAKPEDVERYNGKDLTVVLKEYREKRSKNANSYFHKLCDEIRQKLNISMAHAKNDLITTYGQIWYLADGEPWIYKSNAPLELVQELEDHHMKFIKNDPDDASISWYKVFRGSHTYDTKEMSLLIDGTVFEAKELGIETLTPNELDKLKAAWGNK